jgi:hypothetical protein
MGKNLGKAWRKQNRDAFSPFCPLQVGPIQTNTPNEILMTIIKKCFTSRVYKIIMALSYM